jgi:hypothetical protein
MCARQHYRGVVANYATIDPVPVAWQRTKQPINMQCWCCTVCNDTIKWHVLVRSGDVAFTARQKRARNCVVIFVSRHQCKQLHAEVWCATNYLSPLNISTRSCKIPRLPCPITIKMIYTRML